MRGPNVVTGMVAILVLLSGCIDPSGPGPDPVDTTEDPDSLVLTEGWTHTTPEGEFVYEEGVFKGSFAGDQLALVFNTSEYVSLGGAPFLLAAQGNPQFEQRDGDNAFMVTFWNESKPWPKDPFIFAYDYEEMAAVQAEAGGQRVSHGVKNPHVGGILVDAAGMYNGRSALGGELQGGGHGQWRLWLAVTNALELEVEVKLPEGIRLAEPPRTSSGCDVLEASEVESEFMVVAAMEFHWIENMEWNVEVPENATLIAKYHGNERPLDEGEAEYEMHFPDGSNHSYRFESSQSHADPDGWSGDLILSTQTGPHTYKVLKDVNYNSYTPKIIYCIV